MRLTGILAAGAVALSAMAGAASAAENVPYVVRGNTHMLIGVKLDETAVREILPEGLEPAEGVTGGLQVYTSGGGEGVAPYTRTYVWVNLAGYDSLTGSQGRFILWLADTVHAEKMANLGYITTPGDVTLSEADGTLTGMASVDGVQIIKGSVTAGDCGPGTGVINYPSIPKWADSMAVTQYSFAGKFCGAELSGMVIDVPGDHPLAKLNPQPAGWAAVARDLDFSATPAMPLPKKE